MQTVGQWLPLPAPAQGGPQGHAAAQGKEQAGAPFDREMAKAQAQVLQSQIPDDPLPQEAEAPPREAPGEGEATEEAMAVLAGAIAAQAAILPQVPQVPQEAQPDAAIPAVEAQGTVQEALIEPINPSDADVSILEGIAAQAAQTATELAPEGREAQAQVMDDPGAQGAKAPEAELAARMPSPMDSMIESWDMEKEEAPAAQGIPSSLENEDVSAAKAPPPQRVEITQLAAEQTQANADPRDSQGEPQEEQARAGESRTEQVRQSADATLEQPEQDALFAVRAEPAAVGAPQGAQSPAQTAPLPPAEQLAQEAQVQQAMGRTHFTMHLRPESLGEVTVRLTMVGEAVTARIFTHTEEARQAITQQMTQLGEAMREKGIDVRSVQVVSGNMEQASFAHDGRQGQRGAPQQGQRRRGEIALGSDAMDAVQGYENLFYAPGAQEDRRGVEYRA